MGRIFIDGVVVSVELLNEVNHLGERSFAEIKREGRRIAISITYFVIKQYSF